MKQVELNADKVSVTGPKVDGGYTVKFEVGEYNQEQVAELLRIPQQVNLKVSVEING